MTPDATTEREPETTGAAEPKLIAEDRAAATAAAQVVLAIIAVLMGCFFAKMVFVILLVSILLAFVFSVSAPQVVATPSRAADHSCPLRSRRSACRRFPTTRRSSIWRRWSRRKSGRNSSVAAGIKSCHRIPESMLC